MEKLVKAQRLSSGETSTTLPLDATYSCDFYKKRMNELSYEAEALMLKLLDRKIIVVKFEIQCDVVSGIIESLLDAKQ